MAILMPITNQVTYTNFKILLYSALYIFLNFYESLQVGYYYPGG